MFKKKNYKTVFTYFFVFILFSTNVLAASFVRSQFQDLEIRVHKKFDVSLIAQRLAMVKEPVAWGSQVDGDLSVYVAIKWIEQDHILQGFNLLEGLDRTQLDSDLVTYYRAFSLLNLNKPDLAVPMIHQLEGTYQDDVDVLILKTTYMVYSNQLIEAIELANQFISKHPSEGYAYFQRGYLNLLALSQAIALDDFRKAAKFLPKKDLRKRQQALFQMSMIYLKYNFDSKKAALYYKKGVALDPNSDLVQIVKKEIMAR